MAKAATLFLLCGKICAGKSTLAAKLVEQHGALLIAQDEWLATLYPGEIKTLEDYRRCNGRLTEVMGPHVQAILRRGVSVVLDFPANTVKARQWMKSIVDASGCAHELHFLDVPDQVCKERLRRRNEAGTHAYESSETDFDLFTSYFVPPDPSEGFNIIVHKV